MLEKHLTAKIMKELQAIPNSWWLKVHGHSMQRVGVPDIIGCLEGKFVALEVKTPGNRPTKIQEKELDAIKQAKGKCGWVVSMEETRTILKGSGL